MTVEFGFHPAHQLRVFIEGMVELIHDVLDSGGMFLGQGDSVFAPFEAFILMGFVFEVDIKTEQDDHTAA